MWKIFFDAWKHARAQAQYQKDLKRFLRIGGIDYVAIQNMVNQAISGVEINVTLPDTTWIEIRREDPLLRGQRILDRELF